MTILEAAVRVNISESAIRGAILRGKIPAKKLELGEYRYVYDVDLEDVHYYVSRRWKRKDTYDVKMWWGQCPIIVLPKNYGEGDRVKIKKVRK